MQSRNLSELEEEIEGLKAELDAIKEHLALHTAVPIARARMNARVRVALVAALLVIPMTAYAAVISLPNTFVNGTVADANEMNTNLDVLVMESNDQDSRISAIENTAVLPSCSAFEILVSDGNMWTCGQDQSMVLPFCNALDILVYDGNSWECGQDQF